MSVGGGLA